MIHKQAIVDPNAKIGKNVEVGPWTIIGPNVEIGDGTWIGPNVVLKGPTKIGRNNKIFQFSSIGEDPQDKKYDGEQTFLEIGDRNVIRESCTVHRGTQQGGGITKLGNDNLLMAYVHVAHDCIVGNQTIFVNNSSIAGHVSVNDYAILSGFVGVHQFCQIGTYSLVTGGSMIGKDVMPYTIVSGECAKVTGFNVIGLKRSGFSDESQRILRQAFKIVFRQSLMVEEAIKQLTPMLAECPEIKPMIDLLKSSERGVIR